MRRGALLVCLQAAAVFAQGSYRGWWRGAELTYQIQDGWAVVEGDILVAPLSEVTHYPTKVSASTRAALVDTGFRWTDGVIPYRIETGLPNPNRVTDAVRMWMDVTPLRFVEWSGEPNYILVRRGSACNSFVGMRGGEQVLNLADDCSASNAAHEFGHALGLYHTQSRADRDSFITIVPANIRKAGLPQFEPVLAGTFESGPYDYGSVMHYERSFFSRNGLPVMETAPAGIPLRAVLSPSPGDVAAILRAYGYPVEEVTVTTHPPGLKILIDGVEHVGPQRFRWPESERHRIGVAEGFQMIDGRPTARYAFARWSDGGEREHEIEVPAGTRLYTANFSQQLHLRTSTNGGAGAVRVEPFAEGGWYPLGTRVRVYPEPGPGMKFVRWFVSQGGTYAQGLFGRGLSQDPADFAVDRENLTYVARFVGTPLATVASTPTGRAIVVDGQTCITPCSYEWASGSTHTLDARDQTGFAGDQFLFSQWGHGGDRVQQVTAGPEAATYNAEFRHQFPLTLSIRQRVATSAGDRPSASSVTVTPDNPNRFYDAGQRIDLTAADGSGWHFSNWSGDVTGASRDRSLVISDEAIVTPAFITSPFILPESVVHDATLQPAGVSAKQVLIIYCPDLGNSDEDLSGWQVLFDDEPGNIVSINSRSIRVVSPSSIAGKRSVTVALANGQRRGTIPLTAYARNPGIYLREDGSAAQNEDGSSNSEAAPEGSGKIVTFRATGLGGAGAEVRIAGIAAEVVSVTAVEGQPEGIFDISVRVPENAGSGPVSIEVTGTPLTSPTRIIHLR